MKLRVLLASLLAVSLAACNATSNTSFRQRDISTDRPSAILIDAKQRAILTQAERDTDGNALKISRFCSEPSPDFVSVMAQSLAAGGTFGKTADPQSINAAFNLAYSRAENGTTIAHTQTINMLRELMFRTCERFLSGGYDEMELSIQAVRDQRLMVSILAIEQLTGAVAPSPVVINAAGSGGAGLGGDAIKTFDKLRDQKKAAESAQATAQTAHDAEWVAKEEGEESACDANKKTYDAEDDKSKLTKEVRDKKVECDKLKSDLTTAKATTKEASDAFTTVQQAMTTGGVSASTVTDAIANGGLSRATPGATQGVADAVQEIVELNFNDDTEVMLFCLRSLRNYAEKNGIGKLEADLIKPLLGRCLEYLDNDVAAKIAETAAEAAEARAKEAEAKKRADEASAALDALTEAEESRFRTLLANLQNPQRNGGNPFGYLNALIDRYFDEYGEDVPDGDALGFAGMRGARNEGELRLAFASLNDLYEERLLELMNE